MAVNFTTKCTHPDSVDRRLVFFSEGLQLGLQNAYEGFRLCSLLLLFLFLESGE